MNKIAQSDVATFRDICEFPNVDYQNVFDQYQEYATRSAVYPGQGTPFGLMYAALGLAEAGEVQNKVKKAFRDDGIFYDRGISKPAHHHNGTNLHVIEYGKLSPERRLQIVKELGGVLWYIAAVCNEIGESMSSVALANLQELCDRTERNTLHGDGDDR